MGYKRKKGNKKSCVVVTQMNILPTASSENNEAASLTRFGLVLKTLETSKPQVMPPKGNTTVDCKWCSAGAKRWGLKKKGRRSKKRNGGASGRTE